MASTACSTASGEARLRALIFDDLSLPEPNSGCWLWLGELNNDGYPRVWNGERRVLAHRAAYALARGPIGVGLQLDHLCRTRSCINPTHLEPVSGRVNTLRSAGPSAVNARKHMCQRGHPLAGDNLYVSADGHRHCRACQRVASHAHYLKHRGELLARKAARP